MAVVVPPRLGVSFRKPAEEVNSAVSAPSVAFLWWSGYL